MATDTCSSVKTCNDIWMLVHICMCIAIVFFFHSCIAKCQSTLRKGCTHNLPRKIPISRLWALPLPPTLRWPLPVLRHKQVLVVQQHLAARARAWMRLCLPKGCNCWEPQRAPAHEGVAIYLATRPTGARDPREFMCGDQLASCQ